MNDKFKRGDWLHLSNSKKNRGSWIIWLVKIEDAHNHKLYWSNFKIMPDRYAMKTFGYLTGYEDVRLATDDEKHLAITLINESLKRYRPHKPLLLLTHTLIMNCPQTRITFRV